MVIACTVFVAYKKAGTPFRTAGRRTHFYSKAPFEVAAISSVRTLARIRF